MKLIVVLILIFSFGCASAQRDDILTIKGFNLLIISDIATDNIQPVEGSNADISGSIPVNGLMVPVDGSFQSGGIMAKSRVEIQAATGGTIVIERALSGNQNAPLPDLSKTIFKPVDHPFGNITVQDDDAMREHVNDERDLE